VAIDCADDPALGDSVMEQLRGLGWPVLRVPPGQFLNNRKIMMDRLVRELALLGVDASAPASGDRAARELLAEALELRKSWRRDVAGAPRWTVA
jgi:hypothetical protein